MAAGPLVDGIIFHGFQPMDIRLPLVVLADEQQRQLPLHGQIQRLVQDAFAGCAVAEEYNHHAALLSMPLSLPHLLG